jgi:acetolactate synthase-1/2/3 large subunit
MPLSKSEEMNGAEVLLELMQDQGTVYIFCSPIAVWAPLWEALAKQKELKGTESPKYINCRHETLAIGLASGYYKITGRPQVVLLATSLGVLNGSLAIRGAYQERIPMLILAPESISYGEVPDLDPGPEWPSLLVDLSSPVRDSEAIIKWAKNVRNPRDLMSDFRRAYLFSETTPRGPTLLGIPFDILMSPVPYLRQSKLIPRPVVAPSDFLRDIAQTLAHSRNPIIITEHAGKSASDVKVLVAISEFLGAPVFEFWMPMCLNFPRNHPLYGKGPVENVLKETDCILAVGCNAPWHPPLVELDQTCKVIVMEEDPMRPRAPYWGYRTDYCIAGDIGVNLSQLYKHLKESTENMPDFLGLVNKRTVRWKAYNEGVRREELKENADVGSQKSIHASFLFQVLNHILPSDSVIVDEIVAQLPFMLRELFQSKSFAHHRGWMGGLGTGISTALGVKLGKPESVVVCIIGDGAFNYNPVLACLGLSQQYKLPILIVICNNQGFASQSWNIEKYFPDGWAIKTDNFYGKVIEPTPDYSKIALAFGGYGERTSTPETLEPALGRGLEALERGNTAIIDVILGP